MFEQPVQQPKHAKISSEGVSGLGVHSLRTPFTGVYMRHPDAARVAEAHRVIERALELGAELGTPLTAVLRDAVNFASAR